MVLLLVEYSEDDDTGCGFGAIVMLSCLALSVLLLRAANTRLRR